MSSEDKEDTIFLDCKIISVLFGFEPTKLVFNMASILEFLQHVVTIFVYKLLTHISFLVEGWTHNFNIQVLTHTILPKENPILVAIEHLENTSQKLGWYAEDLGKPSGGGTASPNIIRIAVMSLPSWGMLPELELQDIISAFLNKIHQLNNQFPPAINMSGKGGATSTATSHTTRAIVFTTKTRLKAFDLFSDRPIKKAAHNFGTEMRGTGAGGCQIGNWAQKYPDPT
ncbi:hypothetical protein ACJX0J_013539 [Zea mays]